QLGCPTDLVSATWRVELRGIAAVIERALRGLITTPKDRRDSLHATHHQFPYMSHDFYFIDARLGLCHLRVPTWAPLRLQFYFNGHNLLAHQLDLEGIGYRMLDNAFVAIDDWERAQALAGTIHVPTLHRKLDQLAHTYCPVIAQFPSGVHW